MLNLMMNADPHNPEYGVMYLSPFINLPKFNLVDGFISDYLHMELEDVTKQFTNYHLRRQYDVIIEELDNKMLLISVPLQISHYSRKISERKDWKAREWENFAVYYSPIIFDIILTSDLMNHWLLFVESLYMILMDQIHIADLDKADEMLHRFF
uniref:Ubiquitin-like protease family profile domain-containing protein n=1 Tax=Trichogramma kaykai TaxID=54128 RepID=A0ABD2WYU6_9HYME